MLKQYLIFGVFLSILQNAPTTARAVAEKYEVSTRTIYRYIDALSMAGLPIVTKCGRGGGLSLMSGFSLSACVFSPEQKQIIKNALQSCESTYPKNEINAIMSAL